MHAHACIHTPARHVRPTGRRVDFLYGRQPVESLKSLVLACRTVNHDENPRRWVESVEALREGTEAPDYFFFRRSLRGTGDDAAATAPAVCMCDYRCVEGARRPGMTHL